MKVPGCHRSPVIKIPITISSPIPQQPIIQQPFVQQPNTQYFQQQIVTNQQMNNQQMVYSPAVQTGL